MTVNSYVSIMLSMVSHLQIDTNKTRVKKKRTDRCETRWSHAVHGLKSILFLFMKSEWRTRVGFFENYKFNEACPTVGK